MPGQFPTRPDNTVVREILEHIRATGQPHTWRGHSHTRPEKGANVIYLAEYDLPPSHWLFARWAPCPICRPNNPKYFRDGKVAWFPDEGEIRMIGGDCYASLVGHEQHQAAMAQFRREQQDQKDEAFVLSQVPKIVEALPIVDENVALAHAVDRFRGRLLPRMGRDIHGRLWSHVRASGELRTVVEVTDRRLVDGQQVERRTEQQNRYASLPGYRMLRPPPYDMLGPRMAEAADVVRDMILGDHPIANLLGDDRTRAIRRLTRQWDSLRTIAEEVHELKRFVDLVTVRTLRTWASRIDTPVDAYFDILEGAYLVGEQRHTARAVDIPTELLTDTPVVPGLIHSVAKPEPPIAAEVETTAALAETADSALAASAPH